MNHDSRSDLGPSRLPSRGQNGHTSAAGAESAREVADEVGAAVPGRRKRAEHETNVSLPALRLGRQLLDSSGAVGTVRNVYHGCRAPAYAGERS